MVRQASMIPRIAGIRYQYEAGWLAMPLTRDVERPRFEAAQMRVALQALGDNCGAAVVGVRGDALALTDAYPKGDTTITWTATDCCANLNTCVQTVAVADHVHTTFGLIMVGPLMSDGGGGGTKPNIEIPQAPNIPQPPFWGVRVVKDYDLRELFQYMNEHYAHEGRPFPDTQGIRESAEAITGKDFGWFFTRYVSINSFTETVLRSDGRDEINRWAPQWGARPTV